MLLNEIFDTIERERPTKDIESRFSRIGNTRDSELDSGYYGYVKNKKSDPHMVQKMPIRITEFQKDGYYQYISEIVRTKIAQHNPYAPRVYKINRFVDPLTKKGKYSIDMERLVPLHTMHMDQIVQMYKKFSNASEHEIRQRIDKIMRDNMVSEYDVLATKVKHLVQQQDGGDDPQLEEIAKLINSVALGGSVRHFALDMHKDNYMVRLTPHGPQLVITDPLS